MLVLVSVSEKEFLQQIGNRRNRVNQMFHVWVFWFTRTPVFIFSPRENRSMFQKFTEQHLSVTVSDRQDFPLVILISSSSSRGISCTLPPDWSWKDSFFRHEWKRCKMNAASVLGKHEEDHETRDEHDHLWWNTYNCRTEKPLTFWSFSLSHTTHVDVDSDADVSEIPDHDALACACVSVSPVWRRRERPKIRIPNEVTTIMPLQERIFGRRDASCISFRRQVDSEIFVPGRGMRWEADRKI
jgi:hypothetical protein